MFRTFGLAIAGTLLIAGSAFAEPDDNRNIRLSAGDRNIASALAERTVTGMDTQEVAALRTSKGDWRNVFKYMSEQGEFGNPPPSNLGNVVSAYNLESQRSRPIQLNMKRGKPYKPHEAYSAFKTKAYKFGRPNPMSRSTTPSYYGSF